MLDTIAIPRSSVFNNKFLDTSFPFARGMQDVPEELFRLAYMSWAAMEHAKANPHSKKITAAQEPDAIGVACASINLTTVQQQTFGRLFMASHLQAAGMTQHEHAGIAYGLNCLKTRPPLIEVVVHECTRGGICRTLTGGAASEVTDLSWVPEGTEFVRLPGADTTCPGELNHSHKRTLSILHNSHQLQQLVAEGAVIIGEACYEASTGRVVWTKVLRSKELGKSVPDELLRIITTKGIKTPAELEGIHPGLKSLNAVVLGNKTFRRTFHPPVPTQIVSYGCADSRVPRFATINAPYGLVRHLQSAGIVVNEAVVDSIWIATAEACENRAKADPGSVTPVVIEGHTQCGANESARGVACGCTNISDIPKSVRPIVHALHDHFSGEYRDRHPNPKVSDPLGTDAAIYGAFEACRAILNFDSPSGAKLRQLVRDGHAKFYPAIFKMDSQIMQFMPSPQDLAGFQASTLVDRIDYQHPQLKKQAESLLQEAEQSVRHPHPHGIRVH